MQVYRRLNVNVLTLLCCEKLALKICLLGKRWRISFGPGNAPLKFPMYLFKVKKSNVLNQENLENLALGLFYHGETKVFYGHSLEI